MTVSLLANGIDPGGLTRDEASDVVGILLRTGRTVHPARWIDSLIQKQLDERSAMLPHARM